MKIIFFDYRLMIWLKQAIQKWWVCVKSIRFPPFSGFVTGVYVNFHKNSKSFYFSKAFDKKILFFK